MSQHKDKAVDFLEMVVKGQIEEAYSKYVNMAGKHHNFYFPPGFPVLKQAMIEDHAQHPAKRLNIGHVLEDGNMVAVHSILEVNPGEPNIAVVHMFRFNEGKIVEMWDIGVPIPANIPNSDGAM